MEDNNSESELYSEQPRTPYLKMFLIGILLALPCAIAGIVDAYPAVVLPQIHLNISEASWFGSIPNFASPFGTLLLCMIVDSYGRKFAILAAVVPYYLGWFLLFLDWNIHISILGRILTGLPTGSIFYPIQVYTTECIAVSDNHLRTSFATWGSVAYSFGMFLVFILSPFMKYYQISAFALILSVLVFFMIYIIIPESPVWLYLQGRLRCAQDSENKLGIFQPILHTSRRSSVELPYETNTSSAWTGFCEKLRKLTRTDVRKSLNIMTIMVVLAQITGGHALLVYKMVAVTNTNSTKIESINFNAVASDCISGSIIFGSRIFASIFLIHFGPKKLVTIASVVLCTGYAAISFVSLVKQTAEKTFYINMVGVWLAIFAYYGGVLLVPGAIISEMFPSDAKGFAAFPIIIAEITGGIVVKSYPYLFLYIGGYIYVGYLLTTLIYTIFTSYFIPNFPRNITELERYQRIPSINEGFGEERRNS